MGLVYIKQFNFSSDKKYKNMGNGKDISILMIIGQFYPFVGGAEKACQKLSKRLIEKGVAVTVLTQHCDGLPEYEEIDGIPVYRKMKGWHPFGITYMLYVFGFLLMHRKSYDIIQCFGLFLFIPPALLMRYLFGKRVVSRLLCSGEFGDFQGIKQLKLEKLILAASRTVDRVIFISSDIKRELIENRFPVNKLVYIPNCVDSDKFKPLEDHENCNSKDICFVGRLEVQKGVEYLIKAMDVIKSKENDVRLFIVGDGQLRGTLEDLCKRLKLEDHIDLVGEKEDVFPYYQQSDLLVLPSESEGMSNVILEAMACGLPVVATNIGGNVDLIGEKIEEIVGDEEARYFICANGILVSPRDVTSLAEAILKLLGNRAMAERMGGSARKKVKELYTLNQVAEEYISLYEGM